MTKTAVIFTRGKDVEGQIEICKAHAAQKGYNVAGVITGSGHEITEKIQALKTKIDRVIVSDMARVSRNAVDLYKIQNDLEVTHGALIERVAQ